MLAPESSHTALLPEITTVTATAVPAAEPVTVPVPAAAVQVSAVQVSAVQVSAVQVSIDEELLALLRSNPAPGPQRSPASRGQANPQTSVQTSRQPQDRAASASAGASSGEAFKSQPLGPHVLGAPSTLGSQPGLESQPGGLASSRSFGHVIPSTSRRVFASLGKELQGGREPQGRELADPESPAVEAQADQTLHDQLAAIDPLASALQLPVSHLSSAFGTTWNGVERRKAPREGEDKIANDKIWAEKRAQAAAASQIALNSDAETGAVIAPAVSSVPARIAATNTDVQIANNSLGLVLYQAPAPNRLPLMLLLGATAATLAGLAFFFGFTPSGQFRSGSTHAASVAADNNFASPLHLQIETPDRAANAAPTGTSVAPVNTMIGIRWDPECIPVLNAQAGRLVVTEADHAPHVITLQPAQLKIGHIYYQASFERAEFRLEVEDSSGAVTKESFLALLPRNAPSSAVGALAVTSPGADSPGMTGGATETAKAGAIGPAAAPKNKPAAVKPIAPKRIATDAPVRAIPAPSKSNPFVIPTTIPTGGASAFGFAAKPLLSVSNDPGANPLQNPLQKISGR